MNRTRRLSLATLIAGLALLVTSSCAGASARFANGQFSDDVVRYHVGAPGAAWKQVSLAQANVAWLNDALDAGLLVNSHCTGVGDSPLVSLSNDLLMGTTEREIIEQVTVPWSGREAMETHATAKLDGVVRAYQLFVGKKDGCVYDVVLSAPLGHVDDAVAAYHTVRDGFDVQARKAHP